MHNHDMNAKPDIPPIMAPFGDIHGKRTPIPNNAREGPPVMAPILIVNCNTAPNFSTTKTRATQIAPKITMVLFMSMFTFLSVNFSTKSGLQKSSKTTAAMELRPVDKELRAALKTPATNNPGKPG
uniref:Uncharacterized protein n=1 Tax=Photinus pyralis TaxID=7054 RepID=A0A1Y1LMK1_PHOPY